MSASINGSRIVEFSLSLKLRKEVSGSFDGACNQLREETDIGKELDDVVSGRQFLLVNVNRITEGLERIEADSDRQNDVHRHPIEVKTHRGE